MRPLTCSSSSQNPAAIWDTEQTQPRPGPWPRSAQGRYGHCPVSLRFRQLPELMNPLKVDSEGACAGVAGRVGVGDPDRAGGGGRRRAPAVSLPPGAEPTGGHPLLSRFQTLALRGDGGPVSFEALPPSHFLIVSGAEIRDPVISEGPFIMNDRSQIEDAVARYRSGAMGDLPPLSDS